jgi:DNA polymerase elongation subunit (family B)
MSKCRICGDACRWTAHDECKRRELRLAKRAGSSLPMPEGSRICSICFRSFRTTDPNRLNHLVCEDGKKGPKEQPKYYTERPFHSVAELPRASEIELPAAPPMKQAVFDIETFALDRAWGVVMAGCILVHGDGPPKFYEFDLTQYPSWPEKRSDDRLLVADILGVLEDCSILYAHNGNKFDIPYLNAAALKFDMPPLVRKLVDPVQIARNKLRLGSNSLAAIGKFLDIHEDKLNISFEVWKRALLDNDPESWSMLRKRNHSDVVLLNEISRRIAPFVGMIDFRGSFR